MEHRNSFTRRGAIAGSLASLLATTGKPGEAQAQLVAAACGGARSDLLILEPGCPRFSALTQGFNRRWTAPHCAKIFVPLTEAAAKDALSQAIAFAGPGRFRVRGGGHCYEDFVFSDETLALIDTSLLNEVGRGPRGVYFAQSGGTNWDLYRQLYWRYGVTLPAGSCYSVGLGGHLCGGGYGLLSRLHGLTVDWLTGIHVVTADRNGNTAANHVSKDGAGNNDLFWAHTGGGGGNFGLITRYEFAQLPVAPERAEIFIIAWKWDDIKRNGGAAFLQQIVECFEDLTRTMPPSFFGILKLQHEAAGEIALVAQNVYDHGAPRSPASSPFVRELTQALMRFRLCDCAPTPECPIVGHPVNIPCPSPYQDLRWWEAVQTLNGSGSNQNGKYKSAYMRTGFSAAQIEAIYKHLRMVPNGPDGRPIAPSQMAQSLLQVDSYGGKINDVKPEATAVWQRHSIMKLQYQTYWQEKDSGPDSDDPHISWIRDFYCDMYAASGGIPDPQRAPNVEGCYINYPDADLNDHGRETALRLYYGDNLPRLMRAKRDWDPGNYFQHRQSILPA
jgi:hypothetical protein